MLFVYSSLVHYIVCMTDFVSFNSEVTTVAFSGYIFLSHSQNYYEIRLMFLESSLGVEFNVRKLCVSGSVESLGAYI